MKVVPVELVKELHGKMCKTNGSPIFGFNRKLDVQYAYHTHIVNPPSRRKRTLRSGRR